MEKRSKFRDFPQPVKPLTGDYSNSVSETAVAVTQKRRKPCYHGTPGKYPAETLDTPPAWQRGSEQRKFVADQIYSHRHDLDAFRGRWSGMLETNVTNEHEVERALDYVAHWRMRAGWLRSMETYNAAMLTRTILRKIEGTK
jgi:hypothetical protein